MIHPVSNYTQQTLNPDAPNDGAPASSAIRVQFAKMLVSKDARRKQCGIQTGFMRVKEGTK